MCQMHGRAQSSNHVWGIRESEETKWVVKQVDQWFIFWDTLPLSPVGIEKGKQTRIDFSKSEANPVNRDVDKSRLVVWCLCWKMCNYLSLKDPEPTTLYKIPENILVFPLCIYTSWATILLQEHKKESIKIQFKTKSGMFIQKISIPDIPHFCHFFYTSKIFGE